jgi:hypothetical protein
MMGQYSGNPEDWERGFEEAEPPPGAGAKRTQNGGDPDPNDIFPGDLPFPDDPPSQPPHPKALPYTRYRDIVIARSQAQVIKGLIVLREMSYWIGPPGSLKSSLLAEGSRCVGAGQDWRGNRNKAGPGAVVYFALERADLVEQRLAAYRERDGLPDLPIVVVRRVLNLMDRSCIAFIVDTIRAAAADYGISVTLAVFDTLAKGIAAGGGDENLARDKGIACANLRTAQDEVDAHFALIGHTGKDATKGARGSNVDLADVDLQVQISTHGDLRTATVTKANNRAIGPLFSFRGILHSFGVEEDGDPIEVYIVDPETEALDTSPKAGGRPANERRGWVIQKFLDALTLEAELVKNEGKAVGTGFDYEPVYKVPATKIRQKMLDRGWLAVDDKDRLTNSDRAYFREARISLERQGIITEDKGFIWRINWKEPEP